MSAAIATLGPIEQRAVAALVPYARNSRMHPPAQLAQIEASIRQWGFTIPVLVDEADGIIAGHGRVIVAARIGMLEVPVLVARGWSDAQRRAYVIADNKIPLGAEWDPEILAAELLELQWIGFDMPTIGFDGSEMLKLLAGPAASPRTRARRRSQGGPMIDAIGTDLDDAIADLEESLGRPVDRDHFEPSARYEQGMPILRREQIDLRCKPGVDGRPDEWTGNAPGFLKETHLEPLVAGLRAVLAKHRGGVPS